MSTNLPAKDLLALADDLAVLVEKLWDREFEDGTESVALSAYRAARAKSPVTLEEFLIVQEEDAQWCRTTVEWIEAVEMTHKHALVLIDARNNARRLAGEGGV